MTTVLRTLVLLVAVSRAASAAPLPNVGVDLDYDTTRWTASPSVRPPVLHADAHADIDLLGHVSGNVFLGMQNTLGHTCESILDSVGGEVRSTAPYLPPGLVMYIRLGELDDGWGMATVCFDSIVVNAIFKMSEDIPNEDVQTILAKLHTVLTTPQTLELPVSHIKITTPHPMFMVTRESRPDLGGEADVVTSNVRTEKVSIVVLEHQTADGCYAISRALGAAPLRAVPRELSPVMMQTMGEFDWVLRPGADDDLRIFVCRRRDTQIVVLELYHPGKDETPQLVRQLLDALPAPVREAEKPYDNTLDGRNVTFGRVYLAPFSMRSDADVWYGLRAGIDTNYAWGSSAFRPLWGLTLAGGLDSGLHGSFEASLHGGVAYCFTHSTGVALYAIGGAMRSGPFDDATTGLVLGGEANVRLPWIDIAGGWTTRGPRARAAVNVADKATSFLFGVDAVSDGPVMLYGVFIGGLANLD